MANTTNLNLSKLAGTEKLKTFPSMNNDNLDAIDGAFGSGFGLNGNPNVNASINNLGDGVAILANGNTHAAITSGWFVYIRNHASLSEGLYRATANISANGTLSGSNVTADTNGGLNTVYNELNSKLPWVKINTQHGTNDTNLPTTAREYLFILSFGTEGGRQALSFNFICPNDNIITGFTFSDGYYINSSSFCFAQVYVNCSTHKAHINSLNISGVEYNTTSYLDVYAR